MSYIFLAVVLALMIFVIVQGDKERERCFKILNALAKHRCNLEKWVGNEKALHITASAGHKELTAWLVEHGADVDCRTKGVGSTPMMLASKYGHAETIADLLLHDADLCKQDVCIVAELFTFDLLLMFFLNIHPVHWENLFALCCNVWTNALCAISAQDRCE